jgi:hypothetical protein
MPIFGIFHVLDDRFFASIADVGVRIFVAFTEGL